MNRAQLLKREFKYEKEYEKLLKSGNIKTSLACMSNKSYEEVIIPFEKWITQLRLLNNINFTGHIYSQCGTITIGIRPSTVPDIKINIPDYVKHIDIRENALSNTNVTFIIQDINSLLVNEYTYQMLLIMTNNNSIQTKDINKLKLQIEKVAYKTLNKLDIEFGNQASIIRSKQMLIYVTHIDILSNTIQSHLQQLKIEIPQSEKEELENSINCIYKQQDSNEAYYNAMIVTKGLILKYIKKLEEKG